MVIRLSKTFREEWRVLIDTVELYTHVNIDQSIIDDLYSRGLLSIGSRQKVDKEFNVYHVENNERKRSVKISYRPVKGELRVRVSIPHYLYGNNLPMVNNVDIFIFAMELYKQLSNLFYNQWIPFVYGWDVSKVDYFYNFYVGDNINTYLNKINKVKLPKLKKSSIGDDAIETVSWLSRKYGVVLRAYDKGKEYQDKKMDELMLFASKGILRVEACYNRDRLMKLLKPASLRFSDVIRIDIALDIMKNKLASLNQMLPLPESDKLNMLELNGYNKTVERVITHLQLSNNPNYIKSLSKRTIARRNREVRNFLNTMRNSSNNHINDLECTTVEEIASLLPDLPNCFHIIAVSPVDSNSFVFDDNVETFTKDDDEYVSMPTYVGASVKGVALKMQLWNGTYLVVGDFNDLALVDGKLISKSNPDEDIPFTFSKLDVTDNFI